MAATPMFPLGSVLFPHMPLHLRVFEERYLIMLAELLKAEETGFGVVLIERGHEVGGGEHRFRVGTIADIAEIGSQDGFVLLAAVGRTRIEVVDWLADEPYPRADVREVPELVWDEALTEQRDEAERLVRRTLAQASEFTEHLWPADLELSSDPVAAIWQLAAITPVGELDQVALLRSTSMAELLTRIVEVTADASVGFGAR
ncbi:MAG TPA: LON peptidase substrate-binding domain-containing protein [Propionibacteriaceae bacterium]